jgi:regulator of RNase E activity RraB
MTLFEENAAVLKDLEAKGNDLGPSRLIDFSHVFPDRASAEAFALEAERAGFVTDIEEVERDEDPWDVTASRDMTPTCENITECEELLDALARAHHGRADGWGF